MNRTMPTPWKPTKAQLLAAHDKLVPDLIAKNLIVLFAGINPGLYTAAIGRHFGRPGNRFWPALHGGGFTPRLFSPLKNPSSSNLQFGITNIVERASPPAPDELTADEIRAGGQRLSGPKSNAAARHGGRLRRHRPLPHRLQHQRRSRVGLQRPGFGGGSHAWVPLPNPQRPQRPLTSPAALAQLFGDLRLWAVAQHGRR